MSTSNFQGVSSWNIWSKSLVESSNVLLYSVRCQKWRLYFFWTLADRAFETNKGRSRVRAFQKISTGRPTSISIQLILRYLWTLLLVSKPFLSSHITRLNCWTTWWGSSQMVQNAAAQKSFTIHNSLRPFINPFMTFADYLWKSQIESTNKRIFKQTIKITHSILGGSHPQKNLCTWVSQRCSNWKHIVFAPKKTGTFQTPKPPSTGCLG